MRTTASRSTGASVGQHLHEFPDTGGRRRDRFELLQPGRVKGVVLDWGTGWQKPPVEGDARATLRLLRLHLRFHLRFHLRLLLLLLFPLLLLHGVSLFHSNGKECSDGGEYLPR
jgi:hypothetical protein